MKGEITLVSLVLIVALVIASIVSFLTVVKPAIESAQESFTLAEARSNMELLDSYKGSCN
jgi:uncharacterized protein YpmB